MSFSPSSTRRRRRSAPRRLLPVLVPIAAIVILLVARGSGSGGDLGAGSQKLREAEAGRPVASFIQELARPWPKVQSPAGSRTPGQLRSPIGGGTRYGDAIEGYQLIALGVRTHNPTYIRTGVRALNWAVPYAPAHARPSIFEILGIAGAYNLARVHFPSYAPFARHRAEWEHYLKGVRLERLPATSYFGNHWLVEAVEVREMLRTGLHSRSPYAILGGQRALADRLSRDLIDVRIPAMANRDAVDTPIGKAFVLSDPPDNPLVYQGLSFGMYARAIQMLGPAATPAAKRTLVKIARASLLVAAPDGDLAYFGRNQEEAWGLGSTAYGAWETASLRESNPALDVQLEALAMRAVHRLRTAYRVGPYGLYYAPIVRTDPNVALKGLDPGAGAPSFSGMVQMMLEWARPKAVPPPRGATIPADHDLRAELSHGESRFVVIRRGRLWYAVRPTTSGKHPDDIRDDFGPIAFKFRGAGGRWRDVVHLRPRTKSGVQSAGPLLRTGGLTGLPSATSVDVKDDGTVSMTGTWHGPSTPTKYAVARLPSGKSVRALGYKPGPLYRAGVPFEVAPTACGLRLSTSARAGDRIEYSVFLDPRSARTGPRAVVDRVSRTTFNHPGRVTLMAPYYSSIQRLVRARVEFGPLPAGPLEITICPRP